MFFTHRNFSGTVVATTQTTYPYLNQFEMPESCSLQRRQGDCVKLYQGTAPTRLPHLMAWHQRVVLSTLLQSGEGESFTRGGVSFPPEFSEGAGKRSELTLTQKLMPIPNRCCIKILSGLLPGVGSPGPGSGQASGVRPAALPPPNSGGGGGGSGGRGAILSWRARVRWALGSEGAGLLGAESWVSWSFSLGTSLVPKQKFFRLSKVAGLASLTLARRGIKVHRGVGLSWVAGVASWGAGLTSGGGGCGAPLVPTEPGGPPSSREVTDSFRKRLYLALCSIPGCQGSPT